MQRERIFFPQGVNMFVPGMQYTANLIDGQPTLFNLGTPAVNSANNIGTAISSQASPNILVALPLGVYTADSPYGRTLRLTPSGDPGAAGGTIQVFGDDYLGQPMMEAFAGANGVTSILYGKKAFYRVRATKVTSASTNATTYAIGTGSRLGLPFKGDLEWARENGILVPVYKRDQTFYFDRSAAEAVAGGSRWLRAPFPGFVKTLIGTPNGGGGATDPVITAKLATVAITGLTVTVDTSDATGLTVTDVPTTPGYNANNRFVTNGLIEVVAAAAAGAFGDRLGLELTPTHFTNPDLTDPQTSITGDPRGTYEPLDPTFDGVKKFEVALVGDNAVNAAGNGGFHGIKHLGA